MMVYRTRLLLLVISLAHSQACAGGAQETCKALDESRRAFTELCPTEPLPLLDSKLCAEVLAEGCTANDMEHIRAELECSGYLDGCDPSQDYIECLLALPNPSEECIVAVFRL